ncbi:hypothetical protein QR685DRAFT_521839 [Neurospora intermedia]|uniref:Uncharacterized protein n=1 Tax=Neurospora intermedia TaxID=5142 RepID=A0ABR3DJ36_NEUIN
MQCGWGRTYLTVLHLIIIPFSLWTICSVLLPILKRNDGYICWRFSARPRQSYLPTNWCWGLQLYGSFTYFHAGGVLW